MFVFIEHLLCAKLCAGCSEDTCEEVSLLLAFSPFSPSPEGPQKSRANFLKCNSDLVLPVSPRCTETRYHISLSYHCTPTVLIVKSRALHNLPPASLFQPSPFPHLSPPTPAVLNCGLQTKEFSLLRPSSGPPSASRLQVCHSSSFPGNFYPFSCLGSDLTTKRNFLRTTPKLSYFIPHVLCCSTYPMVIILPVYLRVCLLKQ